MVKYFYKVVLKRVKTALKEFQPQILGLGFLITIFAKLFLAEVFRVTGAGKLQ